MTLYACSQYIQLNVHACVYVYMRVCVILCCRGSWLFPVRKWQVAGERSVSKGHSELQ